MLEQFQIAIFTPGKNASLMMYKYRNVNKQILRKIIVPFMTVLHCLLHINITSDNY